MWVTPTNPKTALFTKNLSSHPVSFPSSSGSLNASIPYSSCIFSLNAPSVDMFLTSPSAKTATSEDTAPPIPPKANFSNKGLNAAYAPLNLKGIADRINKPPK